MLLICLFAVFYFLPTIILDLLQISHIKNALKSRPLLLEPSEYIAAGNYSLEKLRLSIISHSFSFAVFAFWVLWGFWNLWDFVLQFNLSQNLLGVIFIVSLVMVSSILNMPFELYQIFKIDKKYGFCKQTLPLFFVDFVKSFMLTIILSSFLIYALLVVMDFEFWWLWGFGIVFGVMILANAIYPTLIAPIFNKFTPLSDENLKNKIEEIMQKVGFKSSGIFVMDASKRDGRLNAYFGGFGKVKRVVLFDTLLEKISTNGLIAILGHELGHFKHNDIFKRIILSGVILLALFFIASDLPYAIFESANLEKNNATSLLMLIFLSPIITFLALPITSYFSRRAEFAADEFGAQLSSKACLANALVRLVNENKSFPSSHPLYIFFYYSHPPLLERLKALDYEI